MPHYGRSVQPNLSGLEEENQGFVEAIPLVNAENRSKTGKVYLVGAGPGDPRLITLRGLQCLKLADVVLYDGLANTSLLAHADHAELISVGKHGLLPIWTQQAINEKLVELALSGKNVVRLKGGDPAVFARTAEELACLEQNQISFEVVPGITAALAAASYAGIPLTHRDHASAVALVTGQQQPNSPESMDWAALAKFPGTLIVYMGVTTSQHWTAALIQNGKPATTPAAIVRRCSWGDQLVLRCRLDEVADHLTPASKLRPPVLVIIGDVAKLGETWNWFNQLPFTGRKIWIPRAASQSCELSELLLERGGQVFRDPLIDLYKSDNTKQLDQAVEMLSHGKCDGITFSSSNGVSYFFEHLFASGRDVRLLGRAKIAVVGPATANELRSYGLVADIQPKEDFSASGLLTAIDSEQSALTGQRWIVTTTNQSRDTLSRGLQQRGAEAFECLTYLSSARESISDELTRTLHSSGIDWVVITSSHFAELAFHHVAGLSNRPAAVALGSKVAHRLTELGWPPIAVCQQNTTPAILTTLENLADQPPI